MERKLATVLFVDLVGSTALVTAADPEVVRRRVTRFFDDVTHCVTTHGGIVEKFAGDAVLAAFGVAQAHEDDAERAIRAGLGILEAVGDLELQARIGIEAGEVVVDTTDSTFATGEAVNLAARLQQAAGPGEILIGPGAHSLASGTVETEDARARSSVKGRARAAPRPGASSARPTARSRSARGRRRAADRPRGRARSAREHVRPRRPRPARAPRHDLRRARRREEPPRPRVRRQRSRARPSSAAAACPYGEGITYWPLAEMVKSAAGISDDDPVKEAMEKLRACCEDEAVADLLGARRRRARGGRGASAAAQEISWAARDWADQLADVQPLVLVFEDIHWAEEPLFELIEHLATWVREAPLLLVCLARPELLDVRPGWGGGRMRAAAIELDPLRDGRERAS